MSFETTWEAIDNEFLRMRRAVAENQRFLKALDDVQDNSTLYDGLIGSIAMNLQGFYTGAERILLKVCRDIDTSVPKGEQWHRALIEQVSIETDARPALLNSMTLSALKELCKFRHFVRNAYVYKLDAYQVLLLANTLETCCDNLHRDYLAFKRIVTEK